MKRVVLLAALAVLSSGGPARAQGCRWGAPPVTLATQAERATLVLFGTTRNAGPRKATTDFEVEVVIKDHAARRGSKQIILNGYAPPSLAGIKVKYLIFFHLDAGRVVPGRVVAVLPNSQVAGYLPKALAVKNQPRSKQARFFFNHLESSDPDVASDAFQEFADRTPRELRELAASLPPDRLLRWLRGPKQEAHLLGLYASLLSDCGKKEHGAVLRALLEDKNLRAGSVVGVVEPVFAAYAILDREKGWKYLTDVLKDGKQPFLVRFAALRAARYLYEERVEAVSKDEAVGALLPLLPQGDIADLAIEDLRKWKRWDAADEVLAVRKMTAYKHPVVRRAVLRYCLSCPTSAAAAAFVVEQRRRDPDWVKDSEELLQLEAEQK